MKLLQNTFHRHLASMILIVLMTISSSFVAQSDHYWSQNFNIQSLLIAGAVVGGYAGPGAVYYNPAWIQQDDQHSFAISLKPSCFDLNNRIVS